jgi:hypothetical protein
LHGLLAREHDTHPVTFLGLWGAFVLSLTRASGMELAAIASLGLVVLALPSAGRAMRMLRRARWLLATAFLVFAWGTPGEGLVAGWGNVGPTREGIGAGAEHVLRLGGAVLGLAWVLDRLSRDALLCGLYWFARPFHILGLDPERAAVRLALTLRYVEVGTGKIGLDRLPEIFDAPAALFTEPVSIPVSSPCLRDAFALATAFALAALA